MTNFTNQWETEIRLDELKSYLDEELDSQKRNLIFKRSFSLSEMIEHFDLKNVKNVLIRIFTVK